MHDQIVPDAAPPLWWLGSLPFIGILLSIALLPLLPRTRHWWESNLHRLAVSLGFAALTLAYYTAARGPRAIPGILEHAVVDEYVPFMVVLFCLYVISGGICLRGDLRATPATNTAFLAFGAAIASFVGTTGASMLLIRPLLQTNSQRTNTMHTVVFFIFLVSNVGGCLLPIGDPPLFLGYLRGVPFFWTLGLWPEWLVASGMLLGIYYVWDRRAFRREPPAALVHDRLARQPLSVLGWSNVALLAAVVVCVAVVDPDKELPLLGWRPFPFLRELIMLGLVAVSLRIAPSAAREHNQFNYTAVLEVAALFIGIFICMQVPIEYLRANGAALGVNTPAEFFWATGALSSFLDNAPTYVVFFETAASLPPPPEAAAGAAMVPIKGGAVASDLLRAISLGSVFMGAMTYIGNGPNFMVKSIAEQSGVRMPSFFGYLIRYAIPLLIPVFILITLLFLLPWSPLA